MNGRNFRQRSLNKIPFTTFKLQMQRDSYFWAELPSIVCIIWVNANIHPPCPADRSTAVPARRCQTCPMAFSEVQGPHNSHVYPEGFISIGTAVLRHLQGCTQKQPGSGRIWSSTLVLQLSGSRPLAGSTELHKCVKANYFSSRADVTPRPNTQEHGPGVKGTHTWTSLGLVRR